MNYSYLLKEALRGFGSAKLSTIASIITISLSLILFAVFYNITINSTRLIDSIKERVEVEIFLQDNFTQSSLDSLKETLKRFGGVRKFEYVSKEDALKLFELEFGKEMLEVFESNPLPPSIKVQLYDEYKTTERINLLAEEVYRNPIVSDVIYPQKNLEMIEQNTSGIFYMNLIILLVITISSVFLVSNTIRLVINSKQKHIEIYKLLGGTRNFIRLPFLLEGFIQGLLGGLLAVAMLYLFYQLFSMNFMDGMFRLNFNDGIFMTILIIVGTALGTLGSAFSVRKFLKAKTN